MGNIEKKVSVEQTLHEIAKFQFILSEGRKGNHLIFSPDMIRAAFSREQNELVKLFREKLDEINKAVNHTFSLSSFEEKRNYIRSLPEDIRNPLIYGYFQLLEGNDLVEEPRERILH